MNAAPSLNWKEIDLVLAELRLPGSLVQEIHQPRFDRFVLHLFRDGEQFMLLVSLSPRFPRLHAITEKLPNPAKPLRFASFLRAHVRGARITAAGQVRAAGAAGAPDADAPPADAPPAAAPGERIVRLDLARGPEHSVMWIRLWGSAANALLTDTDGIILDAFYRRPKKGEVSGKAFDPLAVTTSARAAAAATRAGAAAAKEFTIRDLPGDEPFSRKLELLFAEVETRGDLQRVAAQADAELEMSENKVLANIEKLRARLADYGGLERYRELGDLVTSNLHAIGKGERWLRTEDFYHGNAAVEIELRPELTPARNAEAYYDKHRKARLGRGKVEEEITDLERTLARIRRQRAAAAENTDPDALERVTRGAVRARKPQMDTGMPGLVFLSPPYRIVVGRTAAENDELLRRKMRGNDWWFHARDWPGAYVFVKAQPGKSLPLETMIDAATLAVHYSKGKTSGQGDVYYTQVKYLRRAKGAKKGTVLPTQEKNLRVKIDPLRIERLKTGESGESGG
jgi:predicted ribosome quality control (RQC) complex YloA/Tae2 family protein